MFWRFGFDNGSSIDSLLDKEEVSLEAILDEDDLLQECKSQNTRLIDYFQRTDVLQRLLGYVTGQIEGEDTGRFKYPYVATEVLCSEIWSIVETCLNHTEQLLTPFWETVLDRPPEDMRTEMVMASHFVKVNAVFLSKKPVEMLTFIRSQPSIIERILQHIETPAFADLLVRIIQLDEQPGGAGVLEWLSDEGLMPRLISRLSPSHSPDMHTVVSDLIKSIISMAAPSPGTAITESQNSGPASNCFARELARRSNVQTLVDYMLIDFGPETGSSPPQDSASDKEADPFAIDTDPTYPNLESCTSSVVHSICIIIELIRQNNSDYFEPYLFHTLRNRLIQVQQSLTTRDPEEGRIALEGAMKEMVDRMGVVHLGPVLEILSEKLDQLHQYLLKPRSLEGPISTTVGNITPLTFERYRICELFAELLHCSNMSLLNRPAEFSYLYDADGRLQGGLTALEDLAHVISMGSGDDGDNDAMDEGADELEPAMELPVHSASHDDPSLLDSDEDMSDGVGPGSSDDDPMEDIAITDSPNPVSISIPGPPSSPSPVEGPSPRSSPPIVFSRSASPSPTSPAMPSVSEVPRRRSSSASIGSNSSTRAKRAGGSRRSSRRFTLQDSSQSDVSLPVGERLKQQLLDAKVLSVVLDLFFDFPWNNFLHSVAYDLIHQILTGRVDVGANRQLAIALFRDAKLMQRIVEGQRRNDAESAKPKGVRLGYMGHLTLISEDVVLAMEHFPPDLRALIGAYAPQPDWDDYINGRYNETKERDTSLLGGGKPVVAGGQLRPAGQWRVDEAEATGAGVGGGAFANESEGTARGEFRRASSARPTRENSADFGPAPIEDDDDFSRVGHPTFERYLAQEMHSPDEFGSSSGSSSDASDEEDGGWLSRSQFDIDRPPPVSARPHSGERRPLSPNGFDDEFAPSSIAVSSPFSDPFADDDDDGFGPFSDSAASDPFTFSSNFSDGMQDSFGDFGEFQPAGDGESTPTAGSWTFASGESPASDDGPELKASEGGEEADKGKGKV